MESNSVQQNKKSSQLWKQFLSLSLFLGLTFLAFHPSNASEPYSDQFSLDLLKGNHTSLTLGQDQHLHQSPIDSNHPDPIPSQREESDDEENLENEETSDHDRVAVSKFSVCLRQHIVEIQSVQFFQSVQKRKIIPFFILFQNWKSFLS
jgi:hypothetical protein